MELPTIYNCHIHTFTADHVPDHFLPFNLVRIMRRTWLRNPILWLFGMLIPVTNKDAVARTGRFLARGAFESQQKVFGYLQKQYPEGTRFIVLPMDMEFMGAGKPAVPFERQLKELAALRDLLDKEKKTKGQIIPFCAVDPRRPNVVEEFKRWHQDHNIKGVKIYPNLGYPPDHPILLKVYAYCEKNKLPVMVHCSRGGIRHRELSRAEANALSHPANYMPILKCFPELNFCMAHFGGAEEWERHVTGETPRTGPEASWLTVITDMMRSGEYPNLYTDVAYTLFVEMPAYRPFNYFNFLKVLLSSAAVSDHVLFGTDYYMVEREKVSEKEVSIGLRAHLGDELYFQIAHDNPRRYLYEMPDGKGKAKAKARIEKSDDRPPKT
jgi:predicted TIM-barrel fold metal-dependent hydrolase